MKKRIILLLVALLLTGCTCEYNLNISNNTYTEKIIINSSNSSELNKNWKIPVDIEEYEFIAGADGDYEVSGDIYNYKLNGNDLTLNYTFTKSSFSNSTIPNECYSKFSITNYEDSIIISTSDKFLCLDRYENLTSVKINITIDKPVTSNDADTVKGNTYTWLITKNNANNKPINIIINNKETNSSNNIIPSESSSTNNKNIKKQINENSNYSVAIFLIIFFVVFLISYFILSKKGNKKSKLDD